MQRREFLGMSVAAPLLVAGGECGGGTAKSWNPRVAFDGGNAVAIEGAGLAKPLKLFVATDSHFGLRDSRDDEYAGFYRRMASAVQPKREPFARMVAAAGAAKVDALLLLGDIISFPTLANVEFIDRTLARSGLDYLYISGNHDWHFEGDAGSDIEQRARWTEKRLRPLYRGHNPLMYSKVVGGLRIVMIDNSVYHVLPEQVAFWKAEAAKGDPMLLCMHIPLWQPGYPIWTCGCPQWGAANDPWDKIERRQRWAEKQMPSTWEFIDAVYSTPNLMCIFAGHEHRLMFAAHRGHTQIVVPRNVDGKHLVVSVR